jgi:excisionase family DNA binding protein
MARGSETLRGRLGDDLCTADEAAERLKLHPKTVLRMIREGRLRATRIGKSYRILRADLEAFAGVPEPQPQAAEAASATCIVDVPGVGPELARKWAATVPGALNARGAGGPPMRADVVYDADRAHLKVIITGSPADTADLLRMIGLWLEQLRA